MRAWIIGNGPSRAQQDLTQLTGITFGCNQIYQDFQPTFLVAQDRAVLEQMGHDRIRTVFVPQDRMRQYGTCGIRNMQPIRHPEQGDHVLLSGHWAMLLAARLGFTQLECIGFDLGPKSIYRDLTETNTAEHYQCTTEREQRFHQQLATLFPDVVINNRADNPRTR